METIFEKILRGDISADTVYETDHILAFHDINPQTPIHVVVIPKKKFRSFDEAGSQSPEVLAAFFQGIADTARHLNLNATGYRVVFNVGTHGQQTVDYVHAHILGGKQLSWPPG